ncbi:hypothetical protein H6G89_03220 [Oscillatoria sp. FACHB-1407]|uniref:hypothetical protein n=1 Tax=Oscillatoria sp. FACHB-1407 TaxID=2692847 RepID=UPI0016847938|nr:hypothetical protein [Oscillatoria sp. FACHB-1407]MBD2460047.1 hypothetical protein [Oscillatoria sp. FACHB-1407]
MAWVLGILEFLEFVGSPLGLTASLWISFYYFAVQSLGCDPWVSALLPGIPAFNLYLYLKQLDLD